MGASGGLAYAQTAPNPSQGQLAAPYGAGPNANNNLNSWGIANTPSGSAAAGPNSVVFAPNTYAMPTPGTVVIHLNGKIEVDMALGETSSNTSQTGAPGTLISKVNPIVEGEFFRLYPGFDGLSANGLRYGASAEIRQNFLTGTFPGNLNGATAPSTTSLASSPSANSSASTLFVRRAFVYVASDQVGIVRVGMGDGVVNLLDNGVFSSLNWDAGSGSLGGGDVQSLQAQAAAAISYPFLVGQGADYATTKIVYLTPQVYGLDAAVEYVPSMGNGFQVSGNGVTCNQAGSQCLNLTSGTDSTRWYNEVAGGVRYQQSFGAIDFKAYGMYTTAAKESAPVSAAVPGSAAYKALGSGTIPYDNLSFWEGGLAVSAMNFTAAVTAMGGRINGQLAMDPKGGKSLFAVTPGITYANGPLALGAVIEIIDSQGAAQLTGTSQRHEVGFATGGKYTIAPGLSVLAEYNYQQRHQGGYDFDAGGLGATRDVHESTYLTGIVLTW
jgi:hypothetical protein